MNTLEQFVDAKLRLELDIMEQLRKFQDEYKVHVNRVSIDTDLFIGERISRVTSYRIEVVL